MAERFVNVDRQTPMFLPPDLREWVADNELAHLVLEAVELCDLRAAHCNVRGSGSEQYPPTMMLALLIYAYATGLFSSRRIERATYESVAVRYLCANHHPDHDTIAKFRRENEALFRSCFTQVLLLAREAGVLRVGAVSVDGTRLAGAGSVSGRCDGWKRSSRNWRVWVESFCKRLKQPMPLTWMQEERNYRMSCATARSESANFWRPRQRFWRRRKKAREAGRRDQKGSGCRSDTACVSEPESRRLGSA